MLAMNELDRTLSDIAKRPVLARRIPQIKRKDRGQPKRYFEEDKFLLHRVLKDLTGLSPKTVINVFFGEENE